MSSGNFPVSREILNSTSVLTFKKVEHANGWYEMRTMDCDGRIEFHYGKLEAKKGITCPERLTFQELEKLEDSDVLSFRVFLLFHNTFFANYSFCDSWFERENPLKCYKVEGEARVVDDSDSWVEITTKDEYGTRYHYGKPRELTGTTSSRPLTLEELGQLGVKDMPSFELFCHLQTILLPRIPLPYKSDHELVNPFTSRAGFLKEELRMFNQILEEIWMTSLQENERITSEERIIQTTSEMENIRIRNVLRHLTALYISNIVDREEVVLDAIRTLSEAEHLQIVSKGTTHDNPSSLDEVIVRLRQITSFRLKTPNWAEGMLSQMRGLIQPSVSSQPRLLIPTYYHEFQYLKNSVLIARHFLGAFQL